MTTLLARHATVLVTMDGSRREVPDGAIFCRDGWIEQVGPSASLPDHADEIVDLADHVLLPGLINTHPHLYQTLTRAVPPPRPGGPGAPPLSLAQAPLPDLAPPAARRHSALDTTRASGGPDRIE